MKLKKQFLSLSALLALGMAATTAWADQEKEPVVHDTYETNGIYYVNVPGPTDKAEKVTSTLNIPNYVKTFHVYDDGGPNAPFTTTKCHTSSCGGHLVLIAPEGYLFCLSGSLVSNTVSNPTSGGNRAIVNVINGAVFTNTYSEYILDGYGKTSWGQKMSSGRTMLVEFHTSTTASDANAAGLDLIVEVVFSNAVIAKSGTTTNTHTIPAGKNQFEVQVPASVGNIDNTTTLTAPEGYVLYVANTTTPNGGSMTVDGNLSSTLTVHVTTESSGFASALNVPVHVLKKTTSTTAVDIYTQDDDSYAVAKITDGEYENSGAVSIPSAINVDAIVYDRVFTANKAGTIVLPFSLPSSATTNAKFYYLKNVLQVEGYCKWKATFRNINLINVTLPADNTPYAVIVPEAELKFNLNGGQATFQTKTIADQVETDENKNWIFKGTYQYKLWGANDPEVGLAYALAAEDGPNYSAGQYVKVGNGAYAVPMRAYVRKVSSSVELEPLGRPLAKGEVSSIENLPEVIDAEFVDENEKTTAIGRLNTVTGAIKIDRWFDLKGRSTNHKPTTKGAFFNKKGIAK